MVSAGNRLRHSTLRAAGVPLAGIMLASQVLAGCGFPEPTTPAAAVMTVSSETVGRGILPAVFTCHGAGIHLPVDWSGAPAGTKGFALVVDDSSAPITPFIYWLVVDIGPTTGDLEEGRLPAGARQAMNSAGTATYDAPCPSGRPHSYRFTIYALDKTLNLPAGEPVRAAWTAIAAATIGRGRMAVTADP